MPELTAIHIVLLVVTTVIGAILGFIIRGQRAEQEKAAISTSWQEQIDAQRKEHDRLTDQNKGLMEQVSQFQASNTDAKNRAKELSVAVQEAFERRDELQREIKDIRGNLEVAVSERDQLQSNMASIDGQDSLLQEKDARIEKLEKELESWQNRLPPLIERFRDRNEDAQRLEAELADARERIRELEGTQFEIEAAQTRIEPVTDPEELTDGLEASNDPAEDYVEEADSHNDELIDAEDILEEADLDEDDGDHESGDDDTVEEDHEDDNRDDEDLIADTDDTSVAEAIAEEEADVDTQLEQSLSDTPDDLKQIKGVGPAIEKTLNEMGIFRFQQIAEMSEYDIDRVAQRLKGFRSRIYREDWIGQARDLRDQTLHA